MNLHKRFPFSFRTAAQVLGLLSFLLLLSTGGASVAHAQDHLLAPRLASLAAPVDRTAGIDCDCSRTGGFDDPSGGKAPGSVTEDLVAPGLELVSAEEALSPGGDYRLNVSGSTQGGFTMTVRPVTGGTALVNVGVTADMKWGFSPDDHRFVTWYTHFGVLTVNLYDLQKPSDRLVRSYTAPLHSASAGSSSVIGFSPDGRNLLVSSLSGNNMTQVTVIGRDGQTRFSEEVAGEAGWQFSPDDRRFALWTVFGNAVTVRLYNLTQQPADMVRTQTFSMYSGSEGQKTAIRFSPKGAYLMVAALTDAVTMQVSIIDSAGTTKLNKQFHTNVSWGFSPDDKRFVAWHLLSNHQTTELYDLTGASNRRVGVYEVTLYTTMAGETSRLRFSPNGEYLLVAAVTGQLTTKLALMNKEGDLVYQDVFTHSAAIDTSGQAYGGATWGFGPDKRDRSFTYAWNTGMTGLEWRLVNLEEGEVVQSVTESGVTAGWWQFSPCGDAAALVLQQSQSSQRVWLYSTRIDDLLGAQTVELDDLSLEATSTAFRAVVGGSAALLAANTAATSCTVELVTVQSVVMEPDTVAGGNPSTGTVTLSRAAPAGGVIVSLTTPDRTVDLPGTVTVAAGQTSAEFDIETQPVTVRRTVNISARFGGVTTVGRLVVRPPWIESVETDEDAVPAGVESGLFVQFDGAAPEGGLTAALTSSHPAVVAVPANVTVEEGDDTGHVPFRPGRVAAPTAVTISAVSDGRTKTGVVTVRPGAFTGLFVGADTPCVVGSDGPGDAAYIGGFPIQLVLDFDGLPVPGGASVALTSSDPAHVIVPATALADTFWNVLTVETRLVTEALQVNVTAAYGDTSFSVDLTLVPAPIAYTLEQIDGLPGATESGAKAINNLGQVVGATSGEGISGRGFVWFDGAATELARPRGGITNPADINDFGQVAGYMYVQGAAEGIVWTGNEVRQLYADSTLNSQVEAINNNGVVAGKLYDPEDRKPYATIWTEDIPTSLGTHFGYPTSWATALNDDGMVVGAMGINLGNRVARYLGFYWRPGDPAITPVHSSDFEMSVGLSDVNNLGQMTGLAPYSHGPFDSAVWDEAGYRSLPGVLSYSPYALAMNDGGEIVGSLTRSGEGVEGDTQAMYHHEGATYNLNCLIPVDAPLRLERARDINDLGQIVGSGVTESGQQKGFLLTPSTADAGVDLTVSISADQDTVAVDSLVTYTVQIGNAGANTAREVTGYVRTGMQATVIESTAPQGTCELSGSLLACSLGQIDAGAALTLSVTVRADSAGFLAYGAAAVSRVLESNPADNSRQNAVLVLAPAEAADTAEVAAGEDGTVELAETGALVEFTDPSETAGTITAQRFGGLPPGSNVIAPEEMQITGSLSRPDTIYQHRSWRFAQSSLSGFAYTACLSLDGLPSEPDFDALAVLFRPEGAEAWQPLGTSLRTDGEEQYACATDLTSFGRFALGWRKETGTGTPVESEVPHVLSLDAAYPNPFGPRTSIGFTVPEAGRAEVAVFNLLGQRVATVYDGEAQPGHRYTLIFEPGNLASGMYVYTVRHGSEVRTGKMVLVR